MVRLDVVVLDAREQPVSGLSKADFTVWEDDARQAVAEFLPVNEPTGRISVEEIRRTGALDVASNERFEKGRLLVLVLDDRQTLEGREDRVKQAATTVLEQLGPDDLVAVALSSGRGDGAREFTRDRASLLQAIDSFRGLKTKGDRRDSIYLFPKDADTSFNFGKAYGQLESLNTLTRVARYLQSVLDRRKAVIWVGEGIETDIKDQSRGVGPFLFVDLSRSAAANFVETARRANLVLYAIDPRGPTALEAEGTVKAPTEGDFLPWLDRARIGRESLQVLCDATGGHAAVDVTDFTEAAGRVIRELSSSYILGYYPTDERHPDRFRRIRVEVSRPGLHVRTRQGYWPASRPSKAAALAPPGSWEAALTGILPASGVQLRASWVPFRGSTRSKAALVVAVSATRPATGVHDAEERYDVRLVVADATGRIQASQSGTMTWPGSAAGAASPSRTVERAVLFLARLAPGRYVLRAAARSTSSNSIGSVSTDVTVPDFSAPVELSGMALGARESMSTAGLSAALRELLPFAPTTRRVFAPEEEIAVFVRVYQTRKAAASGVDVVISATGETGAVTSLAAKRLSPAEFSAQRGEVGCQLAIPLSRLPVGDYRLAIEARPADGRGGVARREVPFRVQRPLAPGSR